MAYEEKAETKKKEKSDLDVQATVAGLIQAAINHVDQDLSPQRAKATDYYLGKPFGNEQYGRSQVVLTEVRDAVDGSLPSLLRVFFGPDHAVEYAPKGAEDVPHAKQATDYARYVFEQDNPGVLIALATLKDGLIRKVGAVKWGSEKVPPRAFKISNVTPEQLQALEVDPEVTITKVEREEGKDLVTLHGTRTADEKRVWIEAMPPEELIFGSEERSISGAIFVGHRSEKTRSQLIAMGYSEEVLDEHGGTDGRLDDNDENVARKGAVVEDAAVSGEHAEAGEANDLITYVEGYVRLDVDGDGEAELRRVCTIGPAFHIVNGDGEGEPADYIRMAAWTPNPEPHTIAGLSMADSTMDMQLIKSSLFRSALDSLALSIYNRTAYQEGLVNVEDVLNTEIGAPIRTRSRPADVLQTIGHTWIGKEALGALEYCDAVVEKRIGRDQGSMGLDADALQSSTKSAVGAAVQASQERVELLARLYAEMLLKPLFKGILRELVTEQPRKKMVRLRNEWVEVDPSVWDVDMDVVVRVALGSTLKEEKLAVLSAFAQKQELALSTLGPSNPIFTLGQYAHTLKTALELSGYKDTQNFINNIPVDYQPPPSPPQPSPEMLLAQIEEKKIQLETQKAQVAAEQKERELELKVQEVAMKAEFQRQELEQKMMLERMKIESDMQLKLKELELKYQTEVSTAAIEGEVEEAKERARIDAENAREAARLQLEEAKSVRELEVERERIAKEAEAKAAEKKDKESERETRKSEASKPVVVNVHLPKRGKTKINRDKEGRAESIEETD